MRTRSTLIVLLLLLLSLHWWAAAGEPVKPGRVVPEREVELQEARTLTRTVEELYAAGKYAEAVPYAERALEIRRKVLGEEHPDVAISMDNLAVLHKNLGRYSEAEPLYKRSLEIGKKVLGEEHPDVAITMNNLAMLYGETGRYSEAEPLCKRSLEIQQKLLHKDHLLIAKSMNNLAELYRETGRYSEAEPLYKRSLEIRKKFWGEEHPDVAITMDNLAVLYGETGRYSEAEPLCKRSLEIRKKFWGEEHPDVASSMNNLAVLYWQMGRYAEAWPLLEKVMGINNKFLGEEHPRVATDMSNLAVLYACTGEHRASHRHFNRASQIDDKTREDVFLAMSEQQKLTYVRQTEFYIHAYLSHTSQYLASDPSARIDTLNAWLRWKGVVLEAQGRYLEAAYSSKDPEIQKKFEELTNTRRTLASLQLSRPEKMSFEQYRMRLSELERQRDSLDVELSRLSQDFALEKSVGKADVPSLSRILPQGSVYIDFARIRHYDFSRRTFGAPRYLAFVLLPTAPPEVELFDLGPAGAVDQYINTYLQAMEGLGQYLEKLGEVESPKLQQLARAQEDAARTIYALVLQPLMPSLKGRKQLFLSPDGNLNLMPFEVLPTPEGKRLLEDYLITYVGAGRDIVRFNDASVAQGPALLMANPDYDMGSEEVEKMSQALGVKGSKRRGGVSRDAGSLQFKRLLETKVEADQIEEVLRHRYRLPVRNYQDKEALEAVLYASPSPRVLHLSAHGYFLPDEVVQERHRAMWGSLHREMTPDLGIENPMLRSGIALAGANTSLRTGSDEGLVSAEKILGLSLKGTELVVLSACETGVGKVQSGEGVFGLKRSFILSGAKTVVMTLWKIPSQETVDLMQEFYAQMGVERSKAEALRQARLNIKKKHPNPFYWGALVMVGKPD